MSRNIKKSKLGPKQKGEKWPIDEADRYFGRAKELKRITDTFMALNKIEDKNKIIKIAKTNVETMKKERVDLILRGKRMELVIEHIKFTKGKLSENQKTYFETWAREAKKQKAISKKKAQKLLKLVK